METTITIPSATHFKTANELLKSIQKRPGMYWGATDRPFSSLVAFLMGYKCAYLYMNAGIAAAELLPDDFHKFVTEHYERSFPDGGKGWMTFISEHSSSEQEAFALFFKLREEYDRRHPKA